MPTNPLAVLIVSFAKMSREQPARTPQAAASSSTDDVDRRQLITTRASVSLPCSDASYLRIGGMKVIAERRQHSTVVGRTFAHDHPAYLVFNRHRCPAKSATSTSGSLSRLSDVAEPAWLIFTSRCLRWRLEHHDRARRAASRRHLARGADRRDLLAPGRRLFCTTVATIAVLTPVGLVAGNCRALP